MCCLNYSRMKKSFLCSNKSHTVLCWTLIERYPRTLIKHVEKVAALAETLPLEFVHILINKSLKKTGLSLEV